MAKDKIILVVFLTIIVYILMGVYADFGKLSATMSSFKWQYAILLIVLTTLGYGLRYLKWYIYLKSGDIDLTRSESLFVFLCGLCMIVTPGRIGELWKSWLIKDIAGVKVSKTIPIVVADRVTDAISLIWLSFIGSFYYTRSDIILTGFIISCVATYCAINSKILSKYVMSLTKKRSSKHVDDIQTMHDTLTLIMKPKLFLSLTLLNVIAWFFECLGLYYIIIGFGKWVSVLPSVFIFSFSSLIGGVSMIPGGIGIAEAGISGLLVFGGISPTISVAIAIILRLGSFWYGAILGAFVYLIFKNKFMGVKNE